MRPEVFLGRLGASLKRLGGSWRHLGPSLRHLWASSMRLGAIQTRLGLLRVVSKPYRSVVGTSSAVLEPSWGRQGRQGPSWGLRARGCGKEPSRQGVGSPWRVSSCSERGRTNLEARTHFAGGSAESRLLCPSAPYCNSFPFSCSHMFFSLRFAFCSYSSSLPHAHIPPLLPRPLPFCWPSTRRASPLLSGSSLLVLSPHAPLARPTPPPSLRFSPAFLLHLIPYPIPSPFPHASCPPLPHPHPSCIFPFHNSLSPYPDSLSALLLVSSSLLLFFSLFFSSLVLFCSRSSQSLFPLITSFFSHSPSVLVSTCFSICMSLSYHLSSRFRSSNLRAISASSHFYFFFFSTHHCSSLLFSARLVSPLLFLFYDLLKHYLFTSLLSSFFSSRLFSLFASLLSPSSACVLSSSSSFSFALCSVLVCVLFSSFFLCSLCRVPLSSSFSLVRWDWTGGGKPREAAGKSVRDERGKERRDRIRDIREGQRERNGQGIGCMLPGLGGGGAAEGIGKRERGAGARGSAGGKGSRRTEP